MNESQDQSRRRKREIEWLKGQIDADSVTQSLSYPLGNMQDEAKQKALDACTSALLSDIDNKAFDLCHFYKILGHNRRYFTDKAYISLLGVAEDKIRYAISLEKLASKEREYRAEASYIEHAGYTLNERYLISSTEEPDLPAEEWVVTEFRVFGYGAIHPVHGCKIKKDGSAYAKAQYISFDHNNYKITKK